MFSQTITKNTAVFFLFDDVIQGYCYYENCNELQYVVAVFRYDLSIPDISGHDI